MTANALLILLAPLLLTPPGPAPADDPALCLRVARVHVGDGTVVEGATVLIRDGKIVAVGRDLPAPAGAQVIEVSGGSITPGLIDGNARIEPLDIIRASQRSPQQLVLEFFGHDGLHAGEQHDEDEAHVTVSRSMPCGKAFWTPASTTTTFFSPPVC